MTEDEAKTKLCPLLIIAAAMAPLSKNCIGSSCMLWRLTSPLTPDDGYCGLAPLPNNHHLIHRDSDD